MEVEELEILRTFDLRDYDLSDDAFHEVSLYINALCHIIDMQEAKIKHVHFMPLAVKLFWGSTPKSTHSHRAPPAHCLPP